MFTRLHGARHSLVLSPGRGVWTTRTKHCVQLFYCSSLFAITQNHFPPHCRWWWWWWCMLWTSNDFPINNIIDTCHFDEKNWIKHEHNAYWWWKFSEKINTKHQRSFILRWFSNALPNNINNHVTEINYYCKYWTLFVFVWCILIKTAWDSLLTADWIENFKIDI